MENTTQAPERKKLADGIYEGDLLLLELTNGQFFRGWLQDILLSSEGKPSVFKTDQGMIELAKVKMVRIGQIQYVPLQDVVEAEKASMEAAKEEATEMEAKQEEQLPENSEKAE